MNEKFIGITKSTGEKITGYLLRGNGRVNNGKAYICPELTTAGSDGSGFVLGPFQEVLANAVRPADSANTSRYSKLLEACAAAEITPEDVNELAKLIEAADSASDLHPWIERLSWHVRRCDELDHQTAELQKQIAGLKIALVKQIKQGLSNQLRQDLRDMLVLSSVVGTYKTLLTAAKEIAILDASIHVFERLPIQYEQAKTLQRATSKIKLSTLIHNELQKTPQASYSDAQIKDAIFAVITAVETKEEKQLQ